MPDAVPQSVQSTLGIEPPAIPTTTPAPPATPPQQAAPAVSLSSNAPLASVISGGGLGALVDQLIAREGSSPQGVANNPGNIKFAGLPGQTDSGVKAADGGTYASYDSPQAGRFAIAQLVVNAARGQSPAYGKNPTVAGFAATYGNTARAGGGTGMADPAAPLIAEYNRGLREESDRQLTELQAALSRISALGEGDLQQQMTAIRDAQKVSDDALQAMIAATKAKPDQPAMDAVQRFGGLATIVGILGGMFTKQPLMASLNAAAAAMDGYRQNDLMKYNMAVNAWKAQTELLSRIAEFTSNRLRNILTEESLPIQERISQFNAEAKLLGAGQAARMLPLQGLQATIKHLDDYQLAVAKMNEAAAVLAERQAYHEAEINARLNPSATRSRADYARENTIIDDMNAKRKADGKPPLSAEEENEARAQIRQSQRSEAGGEREKDAESRAALQALGPMPPNFQEVLTAPGAAPDPAVMKDWPAQWQRLAKALKSTDLLVSQEDKLLVKQWQAYQRGLNTGMEAPKSPRQQQTQGLLDKAKQAIAEGKPRDAVRARAIQLGVSPEEFDKAIPPGGSPLSTGPTLGAPPPWVAGGAPAGMMQ